MPRSCPVCTNSSQVRELTKGDLRLVRCPDCRMVYASPVSQTFASGEFYDALAGGYYLSGDKLEADYAPTRFERELRLFRRFCQAGPVLDVGCSNGAFLFQLKTRFPHDYEVLGNDVAGPALDWAESRRIPVNRQDFIAWSGPARFDAITFWAVLEHVVAPAAFLEQAFRLLRPGGHCFVLVPNYDALAIRLLGAKYRYILPQHVNYFTQRTLEKLVSRTGNWTLLQQSSMHFNPLVIAQDLRGSGEFVADEERAKLLKRTTRYKQKAWLRPVKSALGLVESALGKAGLADNIVFVLQKPSQ